MHQLKKKTKSCPDIILYQKPQNYKKKYTKGYNQVSRDNEY